MNDTVNNAERNKELIANSAELASLKADLRCLYRKLQERGSFCRTKIVKQEVFELLKLYRALPL